MLWTLDNQHKMYKYKNYIREKYTVPIIKILKGIEKIIPLTTYRLQEPCSLYAYKNYVSMLILGTELALHYNPLFETVFFSPHLCDQQIRSLTGYKYPYDYEIKLFKHFTNKSLTLVSKGYNIKSNNKLFTDIPYRYSLYKPSKKLQKVLNDCMKDPVFLLYDTEKLDFGIKEINVYDFFGRKYPTKQAIVRENPIYTRRRIEHFVTKETIKSCGLDSAFLKEEKYIKPKQKNKTVSMPVQLIPEQFNILEKEFLQDLEENNSVSSYNKLVCLQHIADNIEEDMYITQYKEIDSGRLYDSNLQRLDSKSRDALLNGNGLRYISVDIKGGTGTIWYNIARRIGLDEVNMNNMRLFAEDPDTYRYQIAESLYMTASMSEKCSLVTLEKFVKKAINMVGYGAKMTPSAIQANLHNMGKGKVKPLSIVQACLDLGISTGYAYRITQNQQFMILVFELKYAQSKAIEHFRINNTNTYSNTLGKTVTVTASKRGFSAFGKIVAHIYQGAEAEILRAVMKYPVNGTPIASIKGAVGLLVHDGYYLSTDVFMAMLKNPLERHVRKLTGYNVTYSYEAKGIKSNNPKDLMEKLTKSYRTLDND